MVRHPFERLVSAYQDKVSLTLTLTLTLTLLQVVKGADPHYTWVGELLRRRYGGASFPAFVRMVLDQGTKVAEEYYTNKNIVSANMAQRFFPFNSCVHKF